MKKNYDKWLKNKKVIQSKKCQKIKKCPKNAKFLV